MPRGRPPFGFRHRQENRPPPLSASPGFGRLGQHRESPPVLTRVKKPLPKATAKLPPTTTVIGQGSRRVGDPPSDRKSPQARGPIQRPAQIPAPKRGQFLPGMLEQAPKPAAKPVAKKAARASARSPELSADTLRILGQMEEKINARRRDALAEIQSRRKR